MPRRANDQPRPFDSDIERMHRAIGPHRVEANRVALVKPIEDAANVAHRRNIFTSFANIEQARAPGCRNDRRNSGTGIAADLVVGGEQRKLFHHHMNRDTGRDRAIDDVRLPESIP